MAPEIIEESEWSDGAEGASDPNKPGAPVFVSNGSGSVTIDIAENGNAAEVTYALRVKADTVLAGYVQTDGTVDAAEVLRTASAWGNVTVTGLTDFVGYTFAAKAVNELAVESAYSDESASMNTLPDIDEGIETLTADVEEYFATSANVRVDDSVVIAPYGATVPETTETDYYGDITLPYTAFGHDSDLANLEVQFAEYKSAVWGAWAAATIKAAPSGDGATALPTSDAGTAHTAVWDGYTDAGNSENCPVKFRLRLQDEAGAWSAWIETAEIAYRNLPGELIFTNAGSDWDDVLYPVFVAAMTSLRGGSVAFPTIKIYETDGLVLVQEKKSVENQAGWKHKTGVGAWTSMTATGIPGTATQIQYTVQDALTENTEYTVTGIMGELRDLS